MPRSRKPVELLNLSGTAGLTEPSEASACQCEVVREAAAGRELAYRDRLKEQTERAERWARDAAELRERVGRLESEAATYREQVLATVARLQEAEAARDTARAESVAERSRADRAQGELDDLKLGAEHQHVELAQMRREVAEAHNRAVVAEQQVIEAIRQREGAEAALARARKWSFLNFLFNRYGKGRYDV